MGKRLTEKQIKVRLAEAITEAGSQAKFAERQGISRSYLTDVLKGRRALAGKVLAALGVRRIVEYEVDDSRTK